MKWIRIPLVLWLAACSSAALADVGDLPSGSSGAFRSKMMAWSARIDEPTAVVVGLPREPAVSSARMPRLSSRFGYRTDPLHGKSRMHAGIDIPGPLGTPILASSSGFVRFAGTAGGYGRMVEIAHENGLITRYAHLSRVLVRQGTPIARGDTIALMGSTGRSTGSHLHFEVRHNGRPANPLAYLGSAPAEGTSYTIWRASSKPHISHFARAKAVTALPAE